MTLHGALVAGCAPFHFLSYTFCQIFLRHLLVSEDTRAPQREAVQHTHEQHILLGTYHLHVLLLEQYASLAVGFEDFRLCHKLHQYHLVVRVPLVQGLAQLPHFLVPYLFRVEDDARIVCISAHNDTARLHLAQYLSVPGGDEYAPFLIQPRFDIANKRTHFVSLWVVCLFLSGYLSASYLISAAKLRKLFHIPHFSPQKFYQYLYKQFINNVINILYCSL